MRRSVTVSFSTRTDGDLRIGADPHELVERRARLAPGEWTWLRQVHGAEVVVVDQPGAHAGAEADAAVTDVPDAVLAVHTADCVPVLLDGGTVVGAAHAGWRGVVGGVLEQTVEAMRALGAGRVTAHVGPHIRARCYEFGADELDEVAARCGDAVRARTAWDTTALDLTAAVHALLEPLGVDVVDHGGCTACEPRRCFSHRARADEGRAAATIVLRDAPPSGTGSGSVAPEAGA
ncbi:MAG TPA: polyphenol oxidase family protein [Acidimicrobiales bacterium]|nr:polyphenol oxidase family protein [Acidimicrobiales bacterium]